MDTSRLLFYYQHEATRLRAFENYLLALKLLTRTVYLLQVSRQLPQRLYPLILRAHAVRELSHLLLHAVLQGFDLLAQGLKLCTQLLSALTKSCTTEWRLLTAASLSRCSSLKEHLSAAIARRISATDPCSSVCWRSHCARCCKYVASTLRCRSCCCSTRCCSRCVSCRAKPCMIASRHVLTGATPSACCSCCSACHACIGAPGAMCTRYSAIARNFVGLVRAWQPRNCALGELAHELVVEDADTLAERVGGHEEISG